MKDAEGGWDDRFEAAEVQALLKHIRDGLTTEFKPALNSERYEIAYPEVEKVTGLDSAKARDVLHFLATEEILLKEPQDAYYGCVSCHSKNLVLRVSCRFCGSKSLRSGVALQHYHCGFQEMEEAFLSRGGFQCPSCHRPLRALGVDYRRLHNSYKCADCGRLSDTPIQAFDCANCLRKMTFEEAELETSHAYRLNPDAKQTVEERTLDLRPIKAMLEARGFEAELDASVKGNSGVHHQAHLIAWRKDRPEGETRPELLFEVVISRALLGADSVSALMVKATDLGARKAVLVGVPEVSKAAARLASFYGVETRSSLRIADIARTIANFLETYFLRPPERGAENEMGSSLPAKPANQVTRLRTAGSEGQIPVLLVMIYEQQAESQKTMRKLLEQSEKNDTKLHDLLQAILGREPLRVGREK